MALRLDCVVIFAAIAGAVLWIEHGHRTVTDASTPAELEALAAAKACPDKEDKPYTASCLAFLEGKGASGTRWRPTAAQSESPARAAAPESVELTADSSGPPCADTDAVPYSANCIGFMTGWFWRSNTPP